MLDRILIISFSLFIIFLVNENKFSTLQVFSKTAGFKVTVEVFLKGIQQTMFETVGLP